MKTKWFEVLGNNNNKPNKVSCHVHNATRNLACSKTDFAYLAPSYSAMDNIILSGNNQQWLNTRSDQKITSMGSEAEKEVGSATSSALWLVLFPCCPWTCNQWVAVIPFKMKASLGAAWSPMPKQVPLSFMYPFPPAEGSLEIIRTVSCLRKWKSREVASHTEGNPFGLSFNLVFSPQALLLYHYQCPIVLQL